MNYPYSSFEDDGQYQTDLSEVASRNTDEEAAGHQQQQLQYHRRVQIEEATRQRQQQQQQQHHQQQTSPSSSDDFNFELQQIKPNRPKNSPPKPIFVDKDGKSMLFYIPEDEPNRNKYRDLIIRYGGVIVEKGFPTVILLSNNEDLYGFSKLKFIDDCIAKNQLLSVFDYGTYGTYNNPEDAAFDTTSIINELNDDLSSNISSLFSTIEGTSSMVEVPVAAPAAIPLPPPHQQQRSIDAFPNPNINNARRGSLGHRFTIEQDEFILEHIRRKPRFRQSQKFYAQLALLEPLRGHTGNSIRSRFRKHLESRLNYIYKTDDQDQLIRDEAGNLIKIGLDEMPGTLKNKFTPEDDYLLCCVALEYMASNNIDSIGLRYSFFDGMYRKYRNHTLQSWRDRFRKYIRDKSDLVDYKEYYENCEKVGMAPRCLTRIAP